jgi:hypothetical protein
MEERENEQERKDFFEPKSNLKEIDFKTEISEMIARVEEGYENELEIYCLLDDLQKSIEAAKERIKVAAIAVREKYPEKTLEKFGKKISITSGGRYDYKTNDEWKSLDSKRKEVEKNMKTAYDMYKQGKELVIDGEIIPPAEFKPSKQSLRLG